MRLLKRDHSLDFSLTRDIVDDNIPRYAILSHTWGPDTEEVTFKELVEGTGKHKAGYNKIRFCAEQAKCDGLEYFWVDTCCIDKSNNTELQEAINSMFRWYRGATKCYVYLSDVSVSASDAEHESSQSCWKLLFRKSKWFTRGWTLQELVAPASVDFFSKEGVLLGKKRSLEESIHEITGIPLKVLRGCSLSDVSITERMTWIERRETTRKEDKAYSLLGIFDINMPLIYGEGEANAFRRLREEIQKASSTEPLPIPVANNAAFDSRAEEHNARCHSDTRVDLLREIYAWVHDPDGKCIFWLNGVAGTGKSTISRTVAAYFKEKGVLGASFLFKRGERDRGNATLLFTTLAAQLVLREPRMSPFVREALVSDPALATKALREQFEKLILQPLSQLHDGSEDPHTIAMVIDALDECDHDNDIRLIIQLFSEVKTLSSVTLRVFFTSRPELPIRLGFKDITGRYQDVSLHQISEFVIEHDITAYLRYELARIRDDYNSLTFDDQQLPPNWPGERDIQTLVHMSIPLFIFAATVCRFIGDETWLDPAGRLEHISNYRRSDSELDKLDSTYLPVLDQLVLGKTGQTRVCLIKEFQNIVGPIVLLAEPLSAWSLSSLLGIPITSITRTLGRLHAVLDIPIKKDSPIRLFHSSFRDFLTDPTKRGSNEFWVDEINTHQILANVCIRHLQTLLMEDICHLKMPGKARANVPTEVVDRYLPAHIQYACRYWVSHLEQSNERIRDGDQTHEFLECHLLHWLEALSLIGKISEAITTISTLQTLVEPHNARISSFLYEAYRFVRNCVSCVDIAPLQLYCSAILFTPESSVLRRAFKVPKWIVVKAGITSQWGPCLQTLEEHSRGITSMDFSPDGSILASSEQGNIVRLWDTATGHCRQVFDHIGFVKCVAFSPDGSILASAGGDDLSNQHGMIKIWDMVTGHCRQVLDRISFVSSIAFSPDGSILALAGGDYICDQSGMIKIWNMATGHCRQVLDHTSLIDSIAISPDGSTLASGEADNIVRLRDIATGHCYQTFKDPAHKVDSFIVNFVFSPNGRMLASAENDTRDQSSTIKLWDIITGHCHHSFGSRNSYITSIAFSPDSSVLASGNSSYDGSAEGIIKLWDRATGHCYQTIKGHDSSIGSIAFSPNGSILASCNNENYSGRAVIKLWDVEAGLNYQTVEAHSGGTGLIVFSPNGSMLASSGGFSYGSGGIIKLWNMTTGNSHQTLEGHNSFVGFIVFSPDNSILASAGDDNGDSGSIIKLWNVESGFCGQILKGHSISIELVAFSPNGSILASGGNRYVSNSCIKLWDVVTGCCLHTLDAPNSGIFSITFSPNSRILASDDIDIHGHGGIKLWDVATGHCYQTLEGCSGQVSSIAFSSDGSMLASGSCWSSSKDDGVVRLWDVATGHCCHTFTGHRSSIWSISFSPDGSVLASCDKHDYGSNSKGVVYLWDVRTGQSLQAIDVSRPLSHMSFDPSGAYLCTDAGTLLLHRSATDLKLSETLSRSPGQSMLTGYGVSSDNAWIMWNSEQVLWLPPEYRSTIIAKSAVAAACSSGQVLIFQFQPELLPADD